ncbi:MAG: hypothetical protein GXP19_05125 [Gammaproteobacteria bacterium]|nr:hypothetical protein [Gammaproteobacteria bacterium]
MQAVLITVVFGVFSLIIFPFSLLSGAAIGLVTLRQGMKQGAIVVISAIVATALIAFISLGEPFFAIGFAAIVWIPIWLLAAILRYTISLQKTLLFSVLFGWLTIIITYSVLDDPAAWWYESVIDPWFTPVLNQPEVGDEQRQLVQTFMKESAEVMTGALAVFIMYYHLLMLIIARWWQSMLYNPGGFRSEFCSLNLGKALTLTLLGFGAVTMLATGNVSTIAGHFAVVVFALFTLQGLAIIHSVVEKLSASTSWLVAAYIFLYFIWQFVALAGLLDNWLNLRNYVNKKKSV